MSAFVDETRFEVRSGDGGDGSASFRREKYVPRGGPDGGDGGKGGDVLFITRRNLSTLSHLRGKSLFKAQNGETGRGRRMHGKNGADMVIFVPPGTHIMDSDTGARLHDFTENNEGETWICLAGGKGGPGNWHYRSSRNQSPHRIGTGKSGMSRMLSLELSLIADIGLVGPPSVGKSSLINAVTAARSRVGDYPFTTRVPHLGVLRKDETEVVLVDIPGLIAGASQGAGLGFQFLRHIKRSKSLAILTDLGESDPVGIVHSLEAELKNFDSSIAMKDRIIIGSKNDLDECGEKIETLRAAFPNDEIYGVSVFTRKGIAELAAALLTRGSLQR